MLPGKKTYRRRHGKGAVVCLANGTVIIVRPNGRASTTVPPQLTHLTTLIKTAKRQFDNQRYAG